MNWEDKMVQCCDCEIEIDQCNDSGSFCTKDMEKVYQHGRADQKDKDIDDIQHIILKNVDDHEQALIEIVYWLRERVNESK